MPLQEEVRNLQLTYVINMMQFKNSFRYIHRLLELKKKKTSYEKKSNSVLKRDNVLELKLTLILPDTEAASYLSKLTNP